MDLNFGDGWIAEFVSGRGGASNGFMQEWIRFFMVISVFSR